LALVAEEPTVDALTQTQVNAFDKPMLWYGEQTA